MVIVTLLFLALIGLLVLIYWVFFPVSKEPTLYEQCDLFNSCGGNLQCDRHHRCLQPAGSPCSSNNDCYGDLICLEWVCAPAIGTISDTTNYLSDKPASKTNNQNGKLNNQNGKLNNQNGKLNKRVSWI